jgi:hypothetical protein
MKNVPQSVISNEMFLHRFNTNASDTTAHKMAVGSFHVH